MAYTRINWQDLPSTATPRNAANLNKMDTAIKEHDDKLLGNTSMGNVVVDSIRSKNLLSRGNIIFGIYNVGQGAYVYGTNACCTANRIEIDNTKDYILSTGNTQTTSSFYVMYYDTNGTYLGNISATFSAGSLRLGTYSNYSNAKYVNFRFDIEPNNLINPMFEVGTTKTTYTPYQELNSNFIEARSQTLVLAGEKYKFNNNYTIYIGTIVVGFTNGVANVDITNLHFVEKPYSVLATICSENYGIKYNFDSSSATSLRFELFNGSGGIYNKTGNVRFSAIISGITS